MGDKNYGVVDSLEALQRLADRVTEGGGPIAFDIETGYHGPDREKFSLHPETAIVVGISLTSSTDWARYVPLAHDVGDNLDNREAARILWPVLATGRGVAHNAPFERRHLSKWFRELLGDDPLLGAAVRECDGYFPLRSDTQVEAYVTAEHEHFGLKYLAEEMFGHKMTELHELFENLPVNKRRFLRFNILELTPRVVKYACEDSVWCLAIHERYYPRLVDSFIYRLDMAVLDCLCEMEEFGVCYDWSFMRQGKEAAHVFRDLFNAEIMTELTEMCDTQIGINLGSPAQIGDVLYNRLGFKTTVYTAGTKDLPPDQRKMSTGKIALAALAKRHPVVKKIQQWKEITKLKVSYLGDERKPGSGYEAKFNYAPDGRAHPNLLSAVVVTGRFSCSDPNYQQSPKKYHFDLEPAKRAHAEHAEAHGDKCKCDEYAPPPGTCFTFNFRDAIVAPPDHYILGFDLSQAELRAIAGEANETALLEAFAKGEDVHTLTASLMLGIPIDEVTPELRAIGKAQPVDEPVLTSSGWRPIGELKVGDQVIARDGTATRVTGVYPQGVRQVYRLGTVDGAEVRASDEHWWEVHPLGQQPRLITTEELAKQSMYQGKQFRWFLPRIEPAQLHGGPHSIDPYVLGLLIGDGSFTTATPMFTSADQELVDAIRSALPIGCKLTTVTSPTRCPSYRIVHEPGHPNRLMTFLRHLGLAGRTAHHKFVPAPYLYGDPATRLAVLQGLLDSDGSNNGAKGVEFVSASQQLCADVQELIRSLGGRANMYYKPGVKAWRLWGRLPADLPPFRLTRKLAKMKPDAGVVNRAIKSVEPDGHAECVCISVEHPERLYITRGYIPTHNTMNFALLYGMGVKSLADRLAISVDEAQNLYDSYFEVYANIAEWTRKQVELGKRQGYVTSKFGRRLPIWEYRSDRKWIRERGDRACVNYPIQGAATGDYMRLAMVRCRKALRAAGLHDRVHMVMNVHDALEFYVHRSVQPIDVIRVLQPAIIIPVKGWPTMQADWHLAKTWGSPVEVVYTADDRLIVKGAKEIEIGPSIEEDDETGEEIVVLPEVDAEVLRRAIEPGTVVGPDDAPRVWNGERWNNTQTPGPFEGRRVIVTITEMPDEQAYERFLTMLDGLPGPNILTLRTPEGDLPVALPHGTALNASGTANVSLILGPVTITYDAADINPATVVDGLSL